MNNNIIQEISFINEPVLNYDLGSPERIHLNDELTNIKNSRWSN